MKPGAGPGSSGHELENVRHSPNLISTSDLYTRVFHYIYPRLTFSRISFFNDFSDLYRDFIPRDSLPPFPPTRNDLFSPSTL